jgi:hypothetical protein
MTEAERIAITKHEIRHLQLAKKLGVAATSADLGWLSAHWNMTDDAQMRQYRMLWQIVEEEIKHER